MIVADAVRTWHVQTSLDPAVIALMCPWPVCGQLSPVRSDAYADLIGRPLNCRFCGLPSTVPDYTKEPA